ncbi:MAG TPA: MASE4 domain-containing protein [Candidatus Sulfotelmatobacter sp.]|nr:MASE4 domain-containing protein [Candidatus Sulfotelmatobacter sp.]
MTRAGSSGFPTIILETSSTGGNATASADPAPFLANTLAGRRDRLTAVAAVLLSLLALAVAVPFATVRWPAVPAFIPAYEAALILTDLITALLLIGQFRQLRTPSVLVLGAGYLFDALIVVAHLLSFPGVFAETGLLGGNEQTTPWLYGFWHAIFPLFVVVYAVIAHGEMDRPLVETRVGTALGIGVLTAVLLAGGSMLIATAGVGYLRPIIVGGDYARVSHRFGAVAWLVLACVPVLLWYRTRARTVLDLWLLVVMITWLLDVLLSALVATARYDFGWYAGRLYGLLAASFVLGALLLEAGNLYGRLARSLDLARARTAALAQSQEQLRHAQKMEAMGQLTGGVAHDFNNLLTIIVGNLDMIERHADDATRVRRLIAAAQRGAARGAKLTQQLLVFARRQLLRPETVNPNRLLLDFEGLISRAVGETIRVELALDPALDPVRIDPGQFEAAILNLVINARDAMPEGGRVSVSSRNATLDDAAAAVVPDARAGAYAVIEVADRGVGIPDALLAKVFEPFFTTKDVGKGSGLGLSQVYGFVRESGGHVRIRSTEGAGTTVELWLPRSAERPADTSDAATVRVPLRAATGGEVVLVVEDDQDVRDLVSESLQELGYHTLVARDAADALHLLRQPDRRIDILFSDIVMPGGMNGAQLAVEARRLRPVLKVLLTSGYTADALSSDHGLSANMDAGLLRKPYRTEDLATQLRVVLGGRD